MRRSLGRPSAWYDLPILPWGLVLAANLITEAVVFAAEALTLLLECLHVTVLLRQLVLQLADLSGTSSLRQPLRLFPLGFWVAFVLLDLLFEAESVENHDIGAVEDQRQEEGEATEVHVTLRVEFAGLDFHTSGAFKHGRAGMC